jgi:dGTPase
MQKNSIQTLSKLAVPLKSKGRFFNEKKTHLRSDFQRDRDRIIHSTAFRRLKHKTQVFVNTTGDHFRTRITHSLEVAQIARTLSKFFNLNEDLCETLSLAHDLGHTPFGHAGEEALNDCMKRFGGFDHNIQTLRTILFLENRYYAFKGLNLTLETLDGLIKHNGPIKNLKKFKKILGINYFKNKINFSESPSLEAQVASISDDIAYNSHDLEDGLKSNLFYLGDLENIPILNKIVIKHKKKLKDYSIDLVIRQIVREIINEMVEDLIITTQKNLKKNKIKNLKDVLKSKYPLVAFSHKMRKFDKRIKSFLRTNMYYHKKVTSNTNDGKKIIRKLFFSIRKNPDKYINVSKYDKTNVARSICDFIAGMTDRYAINLYKKIK